MRKFCYKLINMQNYKLFAMRHSLLEKWLANEITTKMVRVMVTDYTLLLRAYDFMCCPELTEYLSEREMVNFVGKEHFA